MIITCRKFDDPMDREFSRKSVNDAYMEMPTEKDIPDDLFRDLYVVESTKDLVPPHIVNDYHSRDSFLVKKGLVLFHGTVHSTDLSFDYPSAGSFFGTTPAHSLALILLEKKDFLVNGLPASAEDQARYDKRENAKYYGMDERKFTDEAWGIRRTGSTARLLTYVLTRDLVVIDDAGDTISPSKCASFKYDGLVAGYNKGDHWKDRKDLPPNMNEIRICRGPLNDYLQLVEEIIISSTDIQNQIYDYIDRAGYYLTRNPSITIQICPDETIIGWSVVSTGLGLLDVYRFLKDNNAPLDVLFPIFGTSNVYVYGSQKYIQSVITLINIGGGSMIAKIWTLNERDVTNIWNFVEFIVKKYTGIKDNLQDYLDSITHKSKLILLDGWTDKLRILGFPVEKYL